MSFSHSCPLVLVFPDSIKVAFVLVSLFLPTCAILPSQSVRMVTSVGTGLRHLGNNRPMLNRFQ